MQFHSFALSRPAKLVFERSSGDRPCTAIARAQHSRVLEHARAFHRGIEREVRRLSRRLESFNR